MASRCPSLPGAADKVKYVQFLHDASEIRFSPAGGAEAGSVALTLPVLKPPVEIPVVEVVLVPGSFDAVYSVNCFHVARDLAHAQVTAAAGRVQAALHVVHHRVAGGCAQPETPVDVAGFQPPHPQEDGHAPPGGHADHQVGVRVQPRPRAAHAYLLALASVGTRLLRVPPEAAVVEGAIRADVQRRAAVPAQDNPVGAHGPAVGGRQHRDRHSFRQERLRDARSSNHPRTRRVNPS